VKIAIQTWGSTGDTHPFLALAAGLATAGHEVTLAITGTDRIDFTPMAERFGFVIEQSFIGESEAAVNELGKRIFAIADPIKQTRMIFGEMMESQIDAMFATSERLCASHDLMIGHFIMHPARLAAERAGIPWLTVTLNQGAIPSRYSAPNPFPNLGAWLNPWLWRLVAHFLDTIVVPYANALRARYGAAPIDSYLDCWESPRLNLIAVSRQLCPRPADWGEHRQITGFFNLPEAHSDWQMPPDLRAFLDAGEAPVFITFGSMAGLAEPSDELEETTALLVEAVRMAGCRAIIQSHWNEIRTVEAGEHIYRFIRAPHERIFPHCAAVVHHGGAGTTQSTTLSGCPSIVVAHISDQFFWGALLHRQGLAPRMLKRRTLTAAKLAKRIRQVLDDPGYRERAEAAGRRMRAEDGVATAVRLIESMPRR
jgi:UDP:flavonoid glycosyltransferase YjiC (YdhE family)